MKLHRSCLLVLSLLLLPLLTPSAYADDLGVDLSTFAVLGAAAVTNASGGGTAATIITGNLGSATAVTGFPPGQVNSGTIYLPSTPGTTLASAQGDLTAAFTALGPYGLGTPELAGSLSNNTFGPGIYSVVSSGTFDLTANSTLTLSGTGEWVFLMSSSLNTGSGATVNVGSVGAGSSVYWIVPSAATLDNDTDFAGNILAYGLVQFDAGATDLCGRALSETAGVTFAGAGTDSPFTPNQVSIACSGNLAGSNGLNGGSGAAAPEPGTLILLALGFSGIAFLNSKRRRVETRKKA